MAKNMADTVTGSVTGTVTGSVAGKSAINPGSTPASCGKGCAGNVVTITLLVRGDEVTMTSCSSCDRRSWRRAGRSIELRSLLDEIAVHPPLRRAS